MSNIERMRASDAVWLQDSPQNMMIINAVFFTDRMTTEEFRTVFTERVLSVDGGERYDRFRKRIVRNGKKAYWQVDDNFDPARHIFPVDDVELSSEDELKEYVGKEAANALPDDRPRWQIQCFENFGERSAFVIRLHHAMGDGIAMLPVMFSLIDGYQEDLATEKPHVKAAKKALGMLSQLAVAVLTPFTLIRKVLWIPDRSILHGREPEGSKRVGWTRDLGLDIVKQVKGQLGVTVNDVLMASIAGAFRRYFLEMTGKCPKKIRVSMPVNVRTTSEPIRMENKFAVALLELPLEGEDVPARVTQVRNNLDRLKRSLEPWIYYKAVEIFIHLLPFKWSKWVINLFGRKCTCVATNVPGPQHKAYLGGKKLHAMMFWVPQRTNIAIGISILSLDGSVRIGAISDRALMPDPGHFCELVEQEFAAMKSLAEVSADSALESS